MGDAIGIEKVEAVVAKTFKEDDHFGYINRWIASTARDAANTPTTTLRPSLVMGKITASGKYAEYDDSATDGTEDADLILDEQIDLIDEETNLPQDTQARFVWHGQVRDADLIGIDANGRTDLAGRIYFVINP